MDVYREDDWGQASTARWQGGPTLAYGAAADEFLQP
jgi:hypothetical protein